MARARPVILYLNGKLPHEREAINLLMGLPKGERTKFLRQVIVLGREAQQMDVERAEALPNVREQSPVVEGHHDA